METQLILPRRLRLESSTACQLRCPACPTAAGQTARHLGVGYLRLEDFKTIVDDNPWLSDIELSNWGEAFLNSELSAILAYACERDVALHLAGGVNLNDADEATLEAVVTYGLRKLCCSIDGATQETYSTYRVGGNLQQVIENIRTINRFKAHHGSAYPKLRWQFIAFGHNEHEIRRARAMARELDMEFVVKLSWGDLYTPAFSPVRNEKLVCRQTGLGVASRDEFRRRFGTDYVARDCCRDLWLMPQLNYDGRILGCAINHWGDYGNVLTEGLVAGLNSARLSYARDMLMGQAPPRDDIPCSGCKIYARMAETNNWITPDEVDPRYNTGRRFVFLEERLGRERARRVVAFLRQVKRSLKRPRIRRSGKTAGGALTGSTVYPLTIPIPRTDDARWKMHPILSRQTGGLELSVYAAEQLPGHLMHPPHVHQEEELLIVLAGEIEQILPELGHPENREALRVGPGQFTFFPTGFYHTHFTVSEGCSNYLICKWHGRAKPKRHQLLYGRFNALHHDRAEGGRDFSARVLFEGPTAYLRKLQCHVSTLAPGAGYEPHADPYDVLLVVLEGEVQTLGQACVPHHVVFYPAGQAHGIRNTGSRPAEYFVVEFHGAS